MDISKRLILVLLMILTVVSIGSTGYYVLYEGNRRFMDCLYMTVITLTSIGYGEITPVSGDIRAEIYTITLIVFGMGIILYGISSLTALFIEGELSGLLKRKKMRNKIKELKHHYIVCGGGETGRPLIDEFLKNKEKVVLIEQQEDAIQKCGSDGRLLYIKGDATEDEHLIEAGIERASGVVICLPSDKDNLYVTMTARMMNKNLRIVSRMLDPKIEPKLRNAGADHVVSPNFIGALRMASVMIRPTVVDFLDKMLRSAQGTLRIHEITVSENSPLNGRTICQSGMKQQFSLLILGVKENEDLRFNPEPSLVLRDGMILIVMGEVDHIEQARRHY